MEQHRRRQQSKLLPYLWKRYSKRGYETRAIQLSRPAMTFTPNAWMTGIEAIRGNRLYNP
jgi:hypothetical protein